MLNAYLQHKPGVLLDSPLQDRETYEHEAASSLP